MGIYQRITGGWSSRHVRWAVGGVVAVVGLAVGGWLIADHIASIPPDPASDEPEAVVGYFLSRHFDNLSEAERRAYTQAMIRRYASMDSAQRHLAEQEMRRRRPNDGEQMRERMIGMWRDFVVNEARLYVELPPEQRGPWLEQRMNMWRMLGGDPQRSRASGGRDGGAEALTPERQRQVVGFFQNQVLPRTTARDRALVTVMMRDIIREHRE